MLLTNQNSYSSWLKPVVYVGEHMLAAACDAHQWYIAVLCFFMFSGNIRAGWTKEKCSVVWQGDNCAVGSFGSRGPGKGLAEGGQCWVSVLEECSAGNPLHPVCGLEGLPFQILSPADSPVSR